MMSDRIALVVLSTSVVLRRISTAMQEVNLGRDTTVSIRAGAVVIDLALCHGIGCVDWSCALEGFLVQNGCRQDVGSSKGFHALFGRGETRVDLLMFGVQSRASDVDLHLGGSVIVAPNEERFRETGVHVVAGPAFWFVGIRVGVNNDHSIGYLLCLLSIVVAAIAKPWLGDLDVDGVVKFVGREDCNGRIESQCSFLAVAKVLALEGSCRCSRDDDNNQKDVCKVECRKHV
jgi:hypothetical protein